MAVKSVQVIINGVITTLKYNSQSKMYEGDVTAPSKSSYNQQKKYYPMKIKAEDDAGNITQKDDLDTVIGESLRLFVKEVVKPVVTVTSPAEDSHIPDNAPTIFWKVTDNDSGVNPEKISIIVDDGQKITGEIEKTKVTDGYQCSYKVPPELSEGTHTFKFDAMDFDGNSAVQRTLNIVVDTVPPELSVQSPINNLITNKTEITLAGRTNDENSNPVVLKYTLNSGEDIKIPVGTNGEFSVTLTLKEGINMLVVTATDKAGKFSSVTRVVELDIEAPTINNVVLSPNPAITESIVHISAEVTD